MMLCSEGKRDVFKKVIFHDKRGRKGWPKVTDDRGEGGATCLFSRLEESSSLVNKQVEGGVNI